MKVWLSISSDEARLLEFLDDLQLYLEVLLLGRFESGDELVPQTAVLPEKILETQLRRIRLGNEFTLRTAGFDKSPSCGIGLRPTQFVKRYLEGLHIPAQGLHRALFEHPGENRQQLLLRLARQVAAGRVPACGLLLGRSLAQVEPCVFGSQCCIFVGEVHPTLCRHVGIVRNCGIRFPPSAGTELFCVSSTTEESRCSPETGRVEFSVAILSDFNLTVCKTI